MREPLWDDISRSKREWLFDDEALFRAMLFTPAVEHMYEFIEFEPLKRPEHRFVTRWKWHQTCAQIENAKPMADLLKHIYSAEKLERSLGQQSAVWKALCSTPDP